MLFEIFAGLGGVIVFLLILSPILAPRRLKLPGAHVLITGGSSGIGKALAIQVAQKGGCITLLARNPEKLAEAKVEVEKHFIKSEIQKVLCISVDLAGDYSLVEKAINQAQDKLGPVDMLINSAGLSVSNRFEDTPIEDFKKMIDVNYYGSVYATRAVLNKMKKRNLGRIVFISSQAGQVGIFGYTAYSASKFALRGLAESLQMEVKPYNIFVCLAFPPDTDTPGLKLENERKPIETAEISSTAGLFHPDDVAKHIIEDAMDGRFFSAIGIDGTMLACLTTGMAPVFHVVDAVQQIVTMSVFRFVTLFYLESFNRIVKHHKKDRDIQDAAAEEQHTL